MTAFKFQIDDRQPAPKIPPEKAKRVKTFFSNPRPIASKLCLIAIFSILFFIHITAPVLAQNQDLSMLLLDGLQYYRQGEFQNAAEAFHKIANSGVKNGKLFYNLGNSYLKSDDIGKAILWYERALRLIPNDPDLKFNIEYARSLVKDVKEEKKSVFFKVFFFWRHALSERSVKWIAIFSNLCFWFLLAAKKIPRTPIRRIKPLKVLRYAACMGAIIFSLTAFYNYYSSKHIKNGIIISEKASVRSGLAKESTVLFILHAGTKVVIEKETKNHYRIFFSEDKIGWLKKSKAAVI